jgi:hypothetical protein
VEVIIFSWCVLLIELNAWENEWLVGIQALQEGKKTKKLTKKKSDLKKWSSFVGKSSIFANSMKIEMGKTWKTINIDFF